jgi:DNA-binding transcriptional regulator YdaS (Cro superfamily)
LSVTQNPLHREVLAQAAELAGGPARLAKHLGVETAKVQRWIQGKTPPPSKVVFAALNLIEREKHDA